MKLNKNHNAMKNKYISFVVIPAIIFLFILIETFAPSFKQGDRIIFTYLMIGLITFVYQMHLSITHKIKYSSVHYLYILLCINISLFLGYVIHIIIENMDDMNAHWYTKWIVAPLLTLSIIWIVKSLIWIILKLKYKNKAQNDQYISSLEEENIKLKEEMEKIKEQILDE